MPSTFTCPRPRVPARGYETGGSPRHLRQIRSDKHPEGFPNLVGAEREQVEKANELVRFTLSIVREASISGIDWTLEMPASSRAWLLPAVGRLISDADVSDTIVALQGVEDSELSDLRFVSNVKGLQNLENVVASMSSRTVLPVSFARRQHRMALRGGRVFTGPEYKQYPVVLCKALAQIVSKRREQSTPQYDATLTGKKRPREVEDPLLGLPGVKKADVNRQLKSSKTKRLISEHTEYVTVTVSDRIVAGLNVAKRLSAPLELDGTAIPCGAKVFQAVPTSFKGGRISELVPPRSSSLPRIRHPVVRNRVP
jgi:hypothetical protein